MSLLPLLLLACRSGSTPFRGDPPPRPEGFVDPRLSETGASAVIRLWRETGRYTLTPSTLPPGFEARDRFEIQLDAEPLKRRKNATVWRGPSPFPETLEEEARAAAPPGMHLYVGEEELKYAPSLIGKSWRINGDKVLVAWPAETAPVVTVTNPAVLVELQRREFGKSTLPPEQFLQESVTLKDRTREGLLLPAPGRAEWDVTLPQGARFRAWTAMAPLPLSVLRSDGAEVVLSVTVDGSTSEVARQFVKGRTTVFTRWDVDLSAWSGRVVTLSLATEAGGDNHFDHVFLGTPEVWGAPDAPVRHVIVIGLDTTRPDHFGFYGYDRDTTPRLDAVAGSSMVFDHTWTAAPRTRPSFRSAFTGRRPLDAVGSPNISEVFRDHGFATAGVVANVHLQPRFDFNDGFDDWWYDSKSHAGEQVDRALEWLSENQDRDTFLFLHIMDPHLFYNPPQAYKDRFVTDPDPELPEVFNRWEAYNWLRGNRMDDRRKKNIVDLYDAELAYTSDELGRFFDQVDRMPGHNLVVLHSDHGEELFEHGQFEHNHTVYEETTRGLLWFRSGPGQQVGGRISAPATLSDIAPTLFDFAGFADPPPTDGRSLKPLLLGTEEPAATADRAIPVGHLRYGRERWAVVQGGRKYILFTGTGEEELYDLAADPGEVKNLAFETPLGPWRDLLATSHGMQVGRGWRLNLTLIEPTQTFVFRLPEPALDVRVVDPEATIENPANEEWGETPARTVADVGTVALSEDGRTVTWRPGPKPNPGLITVLFGKDVDPTTVVIERDGVPLVTMVNRGQVLWRVGAEGITIVPGTVVVPPIDEATRIRLLRGEQAAESGVERAQLCQLGYVQCDTPGVEGHD